MRVMTPKLKTIHSLKPPWIYVTDTRNTPVDGTALPPAAKSSSTT